MHTATKISIRRDEGDVDLLTTRSFEGSDCWIRANAWLASQRDSFPNDGTYDKHKVTVRWSDGSDLELDMECSSGGRYDNDLDVAGHALAYLEFYAGKRCPPHMTEDRYRNFIEDPQPYVAYLAAYEIPVPLAEAS